MDSERIQLHSDWGRPLLLFVANVHWLQALTSAVTLLLDWGRFGFQVESLLPFVFCAPLWVLARWAARNATPVFASPAGLEMPGRGRTVAWPHVAEGRRLFGGLIAFYRVTFTDGTPPLTFYCREYYLEDIVARFRSRTIGGLKSASSTALPG
jgi:hypothetical protein